MTPLQTDSTTIAQQAHMNHSTVEDTQAQHYYNTAEDTQHYYSTADVGNDGQVCEIQ